MIAQSLAAARWLAADPVARVRTGRSPHAVLHRNGKAALRYFAPAEARHRPVFVSMPLINTWTIFDLLPGKSVVGHLVGEGVPVYLLDWGRPGPEDADVPLDRYVDGTLGYMLDRARRHAGGPLDAIGYCVGGTFLAVHLARHPQAPVERLALLNAPIDFHRSGRLATWARPETFPLDSIVDNLGNFPADLMRDSFRWLKPQGQVGKWWGLVERFDQPGFPEVWAALEQWNEDNVDFPGEAYREYVRACYFDNALVRGGWMLGGRPVDLSRGRQPALVLASSEDHIVPPAAAFALDGSWGGPVHQRTLRGGHVGVCIGKALPHALLEWIRG